MNYFFFAMILLQVNFAFSMEFEKLSIKEENAEKKISSHGSNQQSVGKTNFIKKKRRKRQDPKVIHIGPGAKAAEKILGAENVLVIPTPGGTTPNETAEKLKTALKAWQEKIGAPKDQGASEEILPEKSQGQLKKFEFMPDSVKKNQLLVLINKTTDLLRVCTHQTFSGAKVNVKNSDGIRSAKTEGGFITKKEGLLMPGQQYIITFMKVKAEGGEQKWSAKCTIWNNPVELLVGVVKEPQAMLEKSDELELKVGLPTKIKIPMQGIYSINNKDGKFELEKIESYKPEETYNAQFGLANGSDKTLWQYVRAQYKNNADAISKRTDLPANLPGCIVRPCMTVTEPGKTHHVPMYIDAIYTNNKKETFTVPATLVGIRALQRKISFPSDSDEKEAEFGSLKVSPADETEMNLESLSPFLNQLKSAKKSNATSDNNNDK